MGPGIPLARSLTTTSETTSTPIIQEARKSPPARVERFQTLSDDIKTTHARRQDENGPAAPVSQVPTTTTIPSPKVSSRTTVFCDGVSISCTTGTCYTGLNGYIGCCTDLACSARTTCIPYHANQKVCDENNDGCIFCSDPTLPGCFTMSNLWQVQFGMWCTNETTSTITYGVYSNSNTYFGFGRPIPTVIFTPSWPGSSSTSSMPRTFVVSGGSTYTLAAASSISSYSSMTSATKTANITSGFSQGNDGIRIDTGGIIGIAVGSSVALIALLVFLAWFVRSHRRNRLRQASGPLLHPQQAEGIMHPAAWLSSVENDRRASGGLVLGMKPPYDPSDVVNAASARNRGPELADTGLAPYSRELESPYTRTPASSSFSPGIQHGFHEYGPSDGLLPASSYANHAASHSDPGVISGHESRMTSTRHDSLGVHFPVPNQDSESSRSSEATPNISSASHTIRRVPASIRSTSQDQLKPQSLGTYLIRNDSAAEYVPSPYQYGPPMQQDKQSPTRTTSRRSASPSDVPADMTNLAANSRDYHPLTNSLSAIRQPLPMHLAPTNAGLSPPALITAISRPGSTDKYSASHAPESDMVECRSTGPQVVGPAPIKSAAAPDDRLSARGDWKGWVSPEDALSEGLWHSELDGSGFERKDHDDDEDTATSS